MKLLKILPYLIIAILVGVTVAYAGTLTPPGSPAKSMKSLSDLYQLVNTGANTPSTDFTTPGTVSATMNSLGDIYDLLKTNINAIDTTKILSGTTIFGKAGSASAGYTYPSAPLKTGQTLCYDSSGVPGAAVPCTGANAGQDGQYQKGVAHSYTDNGDFTITDNATGLMWQKCVAGYSSANCATGSLTTTDFATALAACEAATTAGHTDWRLPNIEELISLIDLTQQSLHSSVVNTTYFPNFAYNGSYDAILQGDDMWSSSDEMAGASGNAFSINFRAIKSAGGGFAVGADYKGNAFNTFFCVRSLP